MNNDFNYSDQQYRDPFTNRPQYDFYDEMVVKDAKRATSRSMLSLVFLTLVTYTLVYAAIFGLKFVLVDIMNDIDLYTRITESVYFNMLMNTLPMYAVGVPVMFFIVRKVPKKPLPIEKPKMSFPMLLAMIPIAELAMLAGSQIGSFINAIYSAMLGIENYDPVSDLISETPLPILLLLTVVLAPIMEELIFRKLLLDRLSVYGGKFAIIVSAVAFGLFHGNLDQFFYAVLVGIVLGFVALKSGNWLYSVLIHAVMNFIGGALPMLVGDSVERFMTWFENIGSETDLSNIPSDLFLDYSVTMLYLSLIGALFAGGIVMLVLGIRKRWFTVDERMSIRIPRGRVSGVVFGNVGSILFLVISGILIIFDLFLPIIEQAMQQVSGGGMGV